jgi:hypothetical protein
VTETKRAAADIACERSGQQVLSRARLAEHQSDGCPPGMGRIREQQPALRRLEQLSRLKEERLDSARICVERCDQAAGHQRQCLELE